MMSTECRRRIAYEVLVILGILALFLYVFRIWPVLLIVGLGIFASALWLLLLSHREVKAKQSEESPETEKQKQETFDPETLKFFAVQKEITERITEMYPEARWVWKSPQSKRNIVNGEEVSVLLNHAGGYREVKVKRNEQGNIQLSYVQAPELPPEPGKVEPPAEKLPPNYEYLAFEWVEAHVVELNEQCNESIAQRQEGLLLSAQDLPEPESWPALCQELSRNGLENCECTDEGIYIHLTQGNCRKEFA